MSQSWSKTTRYFILSISLAIIVWFLVAAQGIVGPLAISAMLAYVLNPAVVFVNTRTRLPRKWVVLLVYLSSLSILITLGVIFIPIIPEQVENLVQELQVFQQQVINQDAIAPIEILGFQIPVDELVGNFQFFEDASFVSADLVLGIIQSASTNLAWILVILVTTFYLLQDWHILRDWLFSLAPNEYEQDIRRLYDEVARVWNSYLQGQLVLMSIIGLLTGLGLAALGIPGAATLGILAGILDAILSVGPVIAMIIAAVVAWVSGSSFIMLSHAWMVVLVLGLFGLIQVAENVYLRPRVIGKWLHIHPAIIFVAVMGSLALAGVLVTLIIIPVLSSAGIVGRYIYCKILNIEPWPQPEAPKITPEAT